MLRLCVPQRPVERGNILRGSHGTWLVGWASWLGSPESRACDVVGGLLRRWPLPGRMRLGWQKRQNKSIKELVTTAGSWGSSLPGTRVERASEPILGGQEAAASVHQLLSPTVMSVSQGSRKWAEQVPLARTAEKRFGGHFE